MSNLSLLQQQRLKYSPTLPPILKNLTSLVPEKKEESALAELQPPLKHLFPETCQQPILYFKSQPSTHLSMPALKVGVVFSGGPAPGGHNVIAGLLDALHKMHAKSQLIGFLNGPSGILKNNAIEITAESLALYRNQGGFDLLGTGRTKIETPEQFQASAQTVTAWDLDGLVIIGGDDSNTNAAFLAEYFKQQGIKTGVIGVPKTIDGDLKNEWIEVSFGFDTACKVYAELIGNILKDNLSAKKSYYFIKLMGRSASHIALECALKTHVNMTLISEEIAEQGLSLAQLIKQIADLICHRAAQGKDYGVILIPEGLIEFIPNFKEMIQELNNLLSIEETLQNSFEKDEQRAFTQANLIAQRLTPQSAECFLSLSTEIQEQLLLDRDPHGNVQVAKIETERLLIGLVRKELKQRKLEGKYKGTFASQPLYFGYEGRSAMPSNFDCQYCYALGHVAALLVAKGMTGYMSAIRHLMQPVEEWEILGIPLYRLLHTEWRGGKEKIAIRKALVDLQGKPFNIFVKNRKKWQEGDDYCYPGPIQFEGPAEMVEMRPLTLSYEKQLD